MNSVSPRRMIQEHASYARCSAPKPQTYLPHRVKCAQAARSDRSACACGISYFLSRIELTHVLHLHLHPLHSTSIVSMVPYLSYLSSILAPVYVVVRHAFARSKRESHRFRALSLSSARLAARSPASRHRRFSYITIGQTLHTERGKQSSRSKVDCR